MQQVKHWRIHAYPYPPLIHALYKNPFFYLPFFFEYANNEGASLTSLLMNRWF